MSLVGFMVVAIAGGLGMYVGIGGALELLYYRRRDRAAAWKIQPRRWPTPRARRNEILLGAANMILASLASGWFAHHVASGGASSIYFDLETHGLAFTLATTLIYFLATDVALYGAHRLLHRRPLFRWIHRVHHRWTSPTAFTATAMHPLELALYQGIVLAPLFVLPVHVGGVIAVLVYQNTIALLDHSGVNLGSLLPWQPPPRFHDDHHVHFHVNFGQTLGLWDRLFGTWRRVGRVYGEHVYGGKGAPLGAGEQPLVDYRRPAPAVAADALDTAP
ncbi:MAG TPA: sterol desaturase family protein [Kofleriaceae bacterium]|jgi:lathosterol oxidase|nr:sterol desaturase family protein [Kofleriaceae bacterium]